MGDSQEYKVFIEELGTLSPGYVKLSGSSIQFKNDKTGKVTTMKTDEIEDLNWQRLGNKPGIKLCMQDGGRFRFGGFKDSDYEKVKAFATRHWSKDLEQKELVLKGWNYGDCEVKGQSIEFKSDGRPVFDVPLANVSNCMTNKSEATLEFHQNDDCRTLLMEMRFHIPANEDDDTDPVEEFRKAVLAYAGVESETGQPIASLSQILCTTPRGRYDIKVFPNHLSLHGKTYDYKISIKTIMRLFLVPHKDGRHVYFVISLNPPIKQGQTRYHYLVLEFLKEEEIDLELGLTPEQLKDQYNGKLEKEISGQLYEVVSKIFRVLINMKITVPGNFLGHSGTPAVSCAHKQASGFLYPLEKGFLYIHKPPMYIRFEEVSSVHFARSDVSTRSFDFEIELKSGVSLVFNSIEKEEYNKLYDYVQNKHLRIRNARVADKDQATDRFAGSDEELDPYKEAVMAEGKVRAGDDSESDSEDEDYDLDEDLKKRHEDKPSDEGSGSEPDEEFDSDAGTSDSDGGESGDDDADEPKKKKEKKEKKEKKDKESKEPKERKKREKKAGKKEKDPNAPKRNQSAFMLWLNESRSKIKKEGDSVADVAKKAGELWKSLSEGDKEPFEKQAAEDKERYEREKKEYEDSGAAKAFVASSSKSSGEAKKEKKSPKKATGPSPSKAKSKEYISDSDSDDDEDDKPLRPPKKEKESKKEDKKDAKKEVKKEVKKESSEEESDDDASDSD